MSNVLVIGGGGREHAICWKLSLSENVTTIFIHPGNFGISQVNKVVIVELDVTNHKEVCDWCISHKVHLVIVGPEDPLAAGIADSLRQAGLYCFGPGRDAARIESDKEWAKSFMDRHKIPTARWGAFTVAEHAKEFIRSSSFPALVVKASGLAAGKGVVVADTIDEACQAVDAILVEHKFGGAGDTVVVEELLQGEEVSVLAFTDGTSVRVMLPSQDHKRHLEGDRGANTGGMGAYCPCPLIDSDTLRIVEENVLQRAVNGMKEEKLQFIGVLYAGLMLTKEGPKVLEFNCRFGDPETQVILPLLESDLYQVMLACCEGTLGDLELQWKTEVYAVGVVMASQGYPESSSKGNIITGLEKASSLPTIQVFHSGTAKNLQGSVVTNGGRVLIAVSVATELATAAARATLACTLIQFTGAQFRRDIAHKGIARSILQGGRLTYKASGVDIVAGDSLVHNIKPMVALSTRSGVLGGIGGFGGLFDLQAAGYKDPLLVSGTDGVGTKLKIAQSCGLHSTIGVDLVAMCVNDILAHGAEPLFFLDYFACGRLDVETASQVVAGVTEGCRQAGCALIGGETAEMPGLYSGDDYDLAGFAVGAVFRASETAEMPGLYSGDDYDLAGFAVGAVEREHLLPQTKDILPGDSVIGLLSSGVHSNGYSLVRKILDSTGAKYEDKAPFSTAGKNFGGVREDELLRTFNCGVGAVLIVSSSHQEEVAQLVEGRIIGTVLEHSAGDSHVEVINFQSSMEGVMKPYVASMVQSRAPVRKRVGVLISGSGTNLQSLIEATADLGRGTGAEIVLVISNKPGVQGLARAQKAGIPTMVIRHTNYSSRVDFDLALHEALETAGVELVCLAGFMRVLTGEFVRRWRGRLINIHPALLPLFKGTHAHRQALQAGVRITGCTAHFVEEDVDAGAILAQEAVPIELDDTEETLQERVKLAEHRVFPKALTLVATGKVWLNDSGKLVWAQKTQ
uniref:Trifunctional purine biosynthetic protein adenosine-3 n=1 Tax=Timema poppense TaxID=170557 RepID=A0A7R9CHD9_TIMPO|nr:unnamed protein product [Timema poppensis]